MLRDYLAKHRLISTLICVLSLIGLCDMILYAYQFQKDVIVQNLNQKELIDIFVVNLDRRIKKWNTIEPQLKDVFQHDMYSPQRFSAIDGKEIDFISMYKQGKITKGAYNSLIRSRYINGQQVTIGSLGCSLSHIAIWTKCVESNRTMLVLEDDVIIHDNFTSYIQKVWHDIPSDWGLLYLADLIKTNLTLNTQHSVHNTNLIWKLSGQFWGTYAYFIAPSAAKVLVENVYPISSQIDSYMMGVCKSHNIDVYRTSGNLVSADNTPNRESDVQVIDTIRRRPINYYSSSYTQSIHVFDFTNNQKLYTTTQQVYGNSTCTLWTKADFPNIDVYNNIELFCIQLDILYQNGGIVFSSNTKYMKWTRPKPMGVLKNRILPQIVVYANGVVAYESNMYPIIVAPPKSAWVNQMLGYCMSINKTAQDSENKIHTSLLNHLTHNATKNHTAIIVPIEALIP